MHQLPRFEAMQPGIALDRLGAVQIKDEAPVAGLRQRSLLRFLAELRHLPGLPLVLAEVLHDERAHIRDREQPLAGRVNGEAAQIGGDPVPPPALGRTPKVVDGQVVGCSRQRWT
jgi:hypothetical protein